MIQDLNLADRSSRSTSSYFFHSNLFALCNLCLFKDCPMSSDGVNYVTVFTGARMNGSQDLKGR